MRKAIAGIMRKAAQQIDPQPTRRELWKRGLWITADMRQVPAAELDNEHLVNIAKMLWRQAEVAAHREAMKYIYMPEPNGEMAQVAFAQGMDNLAIHGVSDKFAAHPFYDALARELNKRNLWPQTGIEPDYSDYDDYDMWGPGPFP